MKFLDYSDYIMDKRTEWEGFSKKYTFMGLLGRLQIVDPVWAWAYNIRQLERKKLNV